MALFLLQPGLEPLGQYDFLDTDLANVLGGELGTWDEAARVNTLTEKAAQDVFDGYVSDLIDAGTPDASRPILRIADSSGTDDSSALYLLDEGVAYYGTSLGTLIGGPVGLATTVASGGTLIGPHTAQGSGKVTAWGKPGLYAVSLDAVHSGTVANSQLEAGGDTPLPGESLYRHQSNGKIGRAADAAVTAANNVVGVFVEMRAAPGLVTTPGRLVGAAEAFDRLVLNYVGALFNVS